MKIEEFKYLAKEKKKQILFDNGVHIGTRKEGDYTIQLYQIDSFYVEAFYHPVNIEAGYLKAFTSPDGLDPYLDNVDLSNLM